MTKVQARFPLQRPLDDILLARVAEAHSIYGILRIRPEPGLDALMVEFDASRLHARDVGRALASVGVPVQTLAP